MQSIQNTAVAETNKLIPEGFYIDYYRPKYRHQVEKISTECFDSEISLSEGFLAFDSRSGELVSFAMCSLNSTPEGETFLAVDWLCTSARYRRKRLSAYLVSATLLYALMTPAISYVVANVNSESLALFKKYGFVGEVDGYLEQFNWEYTAFTSTRNQKLINKIRDWYVHGN